MEERYSRKRFKPSKYDKVLIDRVANLCIRATFHALSNGIFSSQSKNFSATSLGGDLVDALLIVYDRIKDVSNN